LHMFSDVGLGPAAVQSPRGEDPDFLNTAWTIQVIRGICLWLGTALIAWPVSLFYGQPLLFWLLPAAGFSAVVEGLHSAWRYVLDRRLYRGRLMATEVTAAVVNLLVTVAGVWVVYPELVAALWRDPGRRSIVAPLGASTVGLVSTPLGPGPLLAASAL